MSAGPTSRPVLVRRPAPARRLVGVVGLALAVAGSVTVAGYGAVAVAAAGGHAGTGGLAAAPAAPGPVLGPEPVELHLGIEHSAFTLTPEPVRVVAGTEVRFVVGNADPIVHELIVGPPEVHAHHESSDHALHGTVPGEVTVGPRTEGVTSFVFDEPGTVEYACHLPGHYAYGMHGTIEVVPA